MPRLYSQRMVACLGDSLTFNVSALTLTWPELLDLALFPNRGASNNGLSGYTVAQIHARYTADVRGLYPAMTVLAGANDLIAGTSATTMWNTDYKPMLDDAVAQGIKVLAFTMPPWGTFSGWTSGKQTQTVALNNLIKSYVGTGYSYFDLYAFAGDPLNAQNQNPLYGYGDGLHFNAAFGAPFVAAILPQAGAL